MFDPYANDLDTYQARELSYFLDYVDAHVFEQLISHGYALFVPASSISALVMTVLVFMRGSQRYTALPVLTRTLLLLVYLSNYILLVTMGMFYRSSKPVLGPLLMAASFYVFWLITDRGLTRSAAWPRRAPVVVFISFCAMSLLDRQGYFYSLLGLLVLLCHVVLVGGRRDVLYAAAAAVVVMLAYNVMIAPALVQAINGYRPSLESQRLPLAELAGHPRLFKWAVILLAETSARLLGDVPPAVCLVVFLLVVMLTVRRWRGAGVAPRISSPSPTTARSWTGWRVAFVAVLVALAHIVMYAVMIARFPPLWDHYDHRLWYYPVPFQAFLLTILVVGFNFIASSWTRARFAMLNAVLGAVIVANVLRWDDNVRLQRQSQWFNTVHTESYILKRSLSDGRAYSTHAGYLPFYRYCLKLSPTLRERAEE